MKKTYNDIANAQEQINELEKLKEYIEKSETEAIRVKIETKHWHGYFEPILLTKKHRIYTSKETMKTIINKAIDLKYKEINNFIDNLIDDKLNVKEEIEKPIR